MRNKIPKCFFNDKGLCKNDRCTYIHAKKTCSSFNKSGFCKDEQKCSFRHPRTICRFWVRGFCNKGDSCQFRHPESFLDRDVLRKRDKCTKNNSMRPTPQPLRLHSFDSFPPLQTQMLARTNLQSGTNLCSTQQGVCSCQSRQ